MEVGKEGDYIPIATLSCIKMGSDESHFNVSKTEQSQDGVHKKNLNNNSFSEEKEQLNRNRAEVLLLTARPHRLTSRFFRVLGCR